MELLWTTTLGGGCDFLVFPFVFWTDRGVWGGVGFFRTFAGTCSLPRKSGKSHDMTHACADGAQCFKGSVTYIRAFHARTLSRYNRRGACEGSLTPGGEGAEGG